MPAVARAQPMEWFEHQSPIENPYPGLRPFEPSESYLFFGRESQVDLMVDRLAASRFLIVLGSSGSGKSSLVNCGLRPALHGGAMAAAGSNWRVAHFRPGSQPLVSMARALAKPGVLFEHKASPDNPTDVVATGILSLSQLGLVDLVNQARLPEQVNLLIVVDQFEELFRYGSARHETRDAPCVNADGEALVRLLLSASERCERIFIVLTMRSDFLGECAALPGLPEAINRGQYLVPRMTRVERQNAICMPARLGGAQVAQPLVTRLLNDLESDPDQLSLLQHALNRSWFSWRERGAAGDLELEHYEQVGGMAAALDQHAEATFSSLDDAQEAIATRVFRALTDRVSDPRGVRRPTRFSTLVEITGATPNDLAQVLDIFRHPSCSFLTPALDVALTEQTVVDISHESLMRVWKRLNGWVDEEANAAELYKRLNADAVLHGKRKVGFLREPELAMALKWRNDWLPNKAWADRYAPGFEATMAFLDGSAEESAHAEQARKRSRWRTLTAIGLVSLIIFAGLFKWQRDLQTERAKATLAIEKANASMRLAQESARAKTLELAADSLTARLTELDAQKASLERALSNLRDQNPFLREEVSALRTQNQKLRWQILELREENRSFADQKATKAQELATLSRKAKALTAQAQASATLKKSMANEVENLSKAKTNAIDANTPLEKQLDELRATNEALRDELLQNGYLPGPVVESAPAQAHPPDDRNVDGVLDGNDIAPGNDKAAALAKEVEQLRARFTAMKDAIAALAMLDVALREDNERLENELTETTKLNGDLRRDLAVLDENLTSQRTTIEQLEKDRAKQQAELNDLSLKRSDLKAQLAAASELRKQLNRQIAALNRENGALRDALRSAREHKLHSLPGIGGSDGASNDSTSGGAGNTATGGSAQAGGAGNAAGGAPSGGAQQ